MEKDKIKDILIRLIDEASVVAPSISNFDKDGSYGSVTDEDLEEDAYFSWKTESESILNQLASLVPEVFSGLVVEDEQVNYKMNNRRFHSRSILVHKVRNLLSAAHKLMDSPLISEPITTHQARNPIKTVAAGHAFIAMPMDRNNHELDDVLDAIKEAAKDCGVHAERIDEDQSNERITDRILTAIERAEYVIVDLTASKPNVYFEAGYAHGLGKIPIYIAKNGTGLEFDLKDYPVLFYKNMRELKDKLRKKLTGLHKDNNPAM